MGEQDSVVDGHQSGDDVGPLQVAWPDQVTTMGLSSIDPQVTLAPRQALRKKGRVVWPVSPTKVFATKTSIARLRICQKKDLYLGSLSRDS